MNDSEEGNSALIHTAKSNYRSFREAGYIEDPHQSDSGYMMSLKLNHPDKHKGYSYGYDGPDADQFVFVNLLLPKAHWDGE